LNEHYSAVLLKKLPEKIGDLGKFLIPCDFPGMAECLALADLGASINLMPFSVWKILSLLDLTPTCMTLELADHSIPRSVGVAKDVYVKVGSFHFSADFVVVDFDVDPRVPLILERSSLKTGRSLIDVFQGRVYGVGVKNSFKKMYSRVHEEKSSSTSKRRLEKVVKSSQAGTSHSLSSSDSLGFGTRSSTLDFMSLFDSVSKKLSRCSSPILKKSSSSTVGKSNVIAIAGKG
nr:reverse transcriptase domain-containing protein [Tanacetum cinerariifolium]